MSEQNGTDYLCHPVITPIIVAIMLKRLGGRASITQADIEDIAFNRIEEDHMSDGSIVFRLIERKPSQ